MQPSLRSAIILLALAALSARALAAQPGDSTRTVVLDTVTAAALGPAVPLLRAPFAVSVVQAAEIRTARTALALTDALLAVPGVQVDNRFNYALGERISIRGFGARAQF